MAIQQHLEILKRGVSAWNQWRKDNPSISPDLSEASLRDAQLEGAHLERAKLRGSYLERANLYEAHLEKADLYQAHLENATLYRAHLRGAFLKGAYLREANLDGVSMEEADLNGAHLENVKFRWAHLEGANLYEAHLNGANLYGANLKRADLRRAYLEGAVLSEGHLEGTRLYEAHLEGANLRAAHLEGANLGAAHLEGRCVMEENEKCLVPSIPADLRGAYFDNATNLESAKLGDEKHGFVSLADVRWESVNLAVVDWGRVNMLGDEYQARQIKKRAENKENKDHVLEMYRTAVRANRQLTVVLRDQGLNEEASYFAYRAQKLQRIVTFRHRNFVSYLFSVFLDVLAGYGFRPRRSLFWYLVVITGFAVAYSLFGHLPFFPDAFVFSFTSFHGRGFFPTLGTPSHNPSTNSLTLHDPLVELAALEAVVGLFIEISFIATFTKRFFGS